nr:protein sel-1 like 1 [Quercus suber]
MTIEETAGQVAWLQHESNDVVFVAVITLTFIVFLATSTAQEVPLQDTDSQWTREDEFQSKLADDVREATVLLRKIKQPSISKLAQYTSKPSGLVGSTVYYAKEAFVLLFMNAPKPPTSLTTSSTTQVPKLSQPLSRAVKLLQNAAEQDSSDAIYLLAEMSFHGNFSHPIDHDEAFRRYKQLAALTGNSTAQYMVGFMYATGLGSSVPEDQAKSMLYHVFAAEQGNTRSEMTLAYRYHAGIATPKNCDESVHWYKRVADKAIKYYRSGPPGGYSLVRDIYRIADEEGGVYGEGASVSSAGVFAKQGGPTSETYADVEDVLEYLHLQSSKGDLKAAFGLARLHYDGARGLKRDFRLAKQYFMMVAREYFLDGGKLRKDASSGTEKLASKAAGYLGRMFLRGEGMEQSFSKARIWFNRGVSNGDALSQYSLGLMYLHGLGVKADAVKAAEYFAPAADQDLAVAQTNLGILFLDQGDVSTATQYFELAARNSHIEAFYYLAELHNQGVGRERSCGLAASYYKIVAEKAEAIWGSLSEANQAHAEGNIQKAIIGYLMAAEQGSEAAQANVAWLLDQSKPSWSPIVWLTSIGQSTTTAARDAVLALMYWTRSAKQNNIDSRVKMGDYYLFGLGTRISAEHAAACYQAAAETMQSAQAMWNLGWMHENGIGIEQDFHLAKRFYDQALETNNEAYLPVKLSLYRLRWRSWWNDLTNGGVKGIGPDEASKRPKSFAEWLNAFLEADAQQYWEREGQYEPDDWDAQHEHDMPRDDEFYTDDIDDGVSETLLLGGLIVALVWLVYYRRQQQIAADARRRQAQQANAAPVAEPGPGEQDPPAAPGQQADGGFFPQPRDPDYGDWVAGGIGH